MEKKIRVLHIAYSNNVGGASVAMYRLHTALLRCGIESKVLTLVSTQGKKDIVFKGCVASFLHRFVLRVIGLSVRLIQPTKYKTTRSLNIFKSGLAKFINNSDFDVINLHWVGNDTISIKEIAQIEKPIVWTMHDMWAILGAEHNNISQEDRYIKGYNKKNRSPYYQGVDVELYIWKLKEKYWKDLKVNIIAVSAWQAMVIGKSYLFRNAKINVINNPINVDQWLPFSKFDARKKLGLVSDKSIILYGAFNFLADPIKGYQLLIEALKFLDPELVKIVYFGSEINADFNGFESVNFGKIHDFSRLRQLYSAADVFVNPSLQETFGQTAVESLSCNTPVVAFSGSGLDDIIVHKYSGYLAQPYLAEELANGIKWVLSNNLTKLRVSVTEKFSADFIGYKYLELYKQIT